MSTAIKMVSNKMADTGDDEDRTENSRRQVKDCERQPY